jgi:hypothetical protein
MKLLKITTTDSKNYSLILRMMRNLFQRRVPFGTSYSLGSEFEPLQQNFRLGSIADEWKTQDWPTLLVLCRDFYNSVNPKGPLKRTRDTDSDRMSEAERTAHHTKIRNWFMNPSQFKSELEAEQKKHPGKCVYQPSRTHSTDTCVVKKECERILLAEPPLSLLVLLVNSDISLETLLRMLLWIMLMIVQRKYLMILMKTVCIIFPVYLITISD